MAQMLLAASNSTLLNGLTVYYALSDTSDATGGGLTLTNHNTVTFSAGKVGNAANFVATSSQYFSRADSAAFQMGTGDFSIACWAKFTATNNREITTYGSSGSSGYGIEMNGTGVVAFISDGANNAFTTPIHAWNDGVWHLICSTVSRNAGAGTGTMICYVDNSVESTKNFTSIFASVNNANGFFMATDKDATNFADVSIDEVAIANRVWTAAEVALFWNSGNGTTYPF